MWVKRVHRSHTSLVLTLPKPACKNMKIVAGDYLMIGYKPADKSLSMKKVVNEEKTNAESKRGIDTGYPGRGSRAKSS